MNGGVDPAAHIRCANPVDEDVAVVDEIVALHECGQDDGIGRSSRDRSAEKVAHAVVVGVAGGEVARRSPHVRREIEIEADHALVALDRRIVVEHEEVERIAAGERYAIREGGFDGGSGPHPVHVHVPLAAAGPKPHEGGIEFDIAAQDADLLQAILRAKVIGISLEDR